MGLSSCRPRRAGQGGQSPGLWGNRGQGRHLVPPLPPMPGLLLIPPSSSESRCLRGHCQTYQQTSSALGSPATVPVPAPPPTPPRLPGPRGLGRGCAGGGAPRPAGLGRAGEGWGRLLAADLGLAGG